MSNLNLILNDEIFTDIDINEISEVDLVINCGVKPTGKPVGMSTRAFCDKVVKTGTKRECKEIMDHIIALMNAPDTVDAEYSVPNWEERM